MLRPIEGTAREYEYRRLAVLGELVGGRLRAVAVPAEALTQFTTPKEDFCANTRTLHAGDTLLRDDLLAALFGAGYTRPGPGGWPRPVLCARRYCGYFCSRPENAGSYGILG